MTRRGRFLAMLMAVAGLAAPAAQQPAAKQLNVLFIISDDLRTELGSYGSRLARTPNIDALAGAGVRFERAYTQFPLCNPTRVSMLTGRRPAATGVMGNRTDFRVAHPDWITLPQLFKQNGYATIRTGKVFHGGIDDAVSWTEGGDPGRPLAAETPAGQTGTRARNSDRWIVLEGDGEKHGDYLTADRAIRHLRENKDRPFFLAVGFVKPHSPPTAPKKFYDLWNVDDIPLPVNFAPRPTVPEGFPKASIRPRNADLFIGRDASEREAKEMIRAYLASTAWVDWNVGRVVAELDALGLRDDTVVVFWGDHGYQLGERGKWSKAGSLFEQGTRTPFIVVAPGAKGNGQSTARVVENLDIYPTLAALCGLTPPPGIEGRSLVPLLNDPKAAWNHPAFSAWSEDGKTLHGVAVRNERWRYAEFGADGSNGAMLFDEQADPHELKNLADDPKLATVREELSALVREYASSAAQQVRAPQEWRDYAGGPESSRFFRATQITPSNVGQLQVAWTYPAGQTDFNPVVARGVVYARGANDSFVALDAATGRQIWIHEGVKGLNVRGVNYWESADGKERRLLFSANNFLQALDARTGQMVTSFGTDGRVDLRAGLDRDPATVNQQTRIPGRVFENLIIMGSATNQEYASAPGDIRAFDVRTGALVWTFHTVPRPGEFGYDTWPADAWKTIGGANNWGEQSIDVKRGIVYVPTSSAKYNFYGGNRKGANLFSDCILALDARTGRRLWHFQTVHHDIWDLDNNSAPQLTTIRRNGKAVDVVAVASKTGYLYVFDRATGTPIWPIEERPVPQGTTVPGESLWPTQPIPTAPPPFSRQSFTADDLNPYILTPPEREQFRQRVLRARNDGPFTPIGFDEVVHMPGNHGGSNWGSTAANPSDGSVYVIGFNVPAIIRLLKAGEARPGRRGAAPEIVKEGRYVTEGFGLFPTIVKPPYTTLTAYDLNSGTITWQIGLGDDLRLAAQGVKGTGTAAMVKGGLIRTATGLLFATAADRKVHVYNSADGKQIAEFQLGGATSGSPSMYEVGGRQFLLVTASPDAGGGAGPTGIIAYALPSKSSRPLP